MSNLGHELSGGTIANILKRHGVEPAPERKRKTMWKEFLSRHFDQIGATDFFTVEVWTKNGPQRFIAMSARRHAQLLLPQRRIDGLGKHELRPCKTAGTGVSEFFDLANPM